jgi:PAS domain S-box-containing protein
MSMAEKTEHFVETEIAELRRRLEEAEDTLRAISTGEVDALVVDSPEGEVIYTLSTADYPYRLMIDEMNQGAVSVAPDSIILFSNRNFAGILGIKGTSVTGAQFDDYVVPRLREQFLRDLQKSRSEEVRCEYVLQHQTGREVPVLISFATLQPETNSISIVVTDLTSQKELEEELRHAKDNLEDLVAERTKELRQSEGRLFRILEHSAADLKAMRRLNEIGTRCARDGNDRDGCLSEVLRVAIEISGADKGNIQLVDSATGRLSLTTEFGFNPSFLEYFSDIHQPAACDVALETQQRVIVEDVRQSALFVGSPTLKVMKDAGVRAVQSTPLISSAGNVLGVISTHFSETRRPTEQELRLMDLLARQAADYLERKHVEEEREELLAREHELRQTAEEANRLKDEFLAIMSHELRNPLNVILGYAELLLRSEEIRSAAPLRRMADAVKRNAVAQSKLIRDLLDLSRLRSGKLELNRETVSPIVSIHNAIETVREDAGVKNIQIDVDALDDEPVFVQADPVRLEQVIWNLLNNAVKFTPRDGRIAVKLRAEPEEIILSVEDNGQGIDAFFLPHIFEIFRQADSSTNRPQSGMGIGLAVVQQLVELHGGSVTAYSAGAGQGASFTIHLPRSAENKEPGVCADNFCIESLEGVNVLVVDDSEDTTEMVRHLLEIGGASVTAVTSGFEALRVAREKQFDVVLSDISMPGMDGFEFLSKLRALPGYHDLPAVALTGFGRPEDVQRAHAEGFYAHLTKPFDIQALAGLLQKMPRQRAPQAL